MAKLMPLPHYGQTLCLRKSPPESRRPRKGDAEREGGWAQVRAEKKSTRVSRETARRRRGRRRRR